MIEFQKEQLTDLIQNKISVKELEIGPIHLGKHYNCIDLFEIVDLYVHNPNAEGLNFESSNFTFRERLEQLKERNGHIHLAGGLTCGIEDQAIKNFRITKKYLEPISQVTREEVLHFHGTPDAELIEDDMYSGFSYAIDSYILVYKDKNLNFLVDPGTSKLTEINTHALDLSNWRKR